MMYTLLFVCFKIYITLFTQCIPETHTAHISENMILRLKDENREHTKSTTVRELVNEEPRLDDLLEFIYDVSNSRSNRQKRSRRSRPQGENTENTISGKRHAKRKAKHAQRTTINNEREHIEGLVLKNGTSNRTISGDTNEEALPLNQALRTEWSPTACEARRGTGIARFLDDDNPYPLCTICTAKTTFPEGTIPNELHETICLPSGDNVVADDKTESCLNGFGKCKQRTKRIELRRLRSGSRPTHAYESEIEQDEWEYGYYEWRYSCDCLVTPGTVLYDHVR